MPLVFNPFDPSAYLRAFGDAVSRASLGAPRQPASAPIPVDVESGDPGIKVAERGGAGRVEVEFSGRARGPAVRPRGDGLAAYWDPQPTSRVVSLGVATAEAPTVDAFGRKSFAEKNARSMVQSTRAGETGRAIAEDFAEQIGRHLAGFRAEVVPGATADAATLVITRR